MFGVLFKQLLSSDIQRSYVSYYLLENIILDMKVVDLVNYRLSNVMMCVFPPLLMIIKVFFQNRNFRLVHKDLSPNMNLWKAITPREIYFLRLITFVAFLVYFMLSLIDLKIVLEWFICALQERWAVS